MRSRALFVVVILSLVAGCAKPANTRDAWPDGIAVLGDSISRATNVKGETFEDHPAHSWVTGTDPEDGILSHYERLKSYRADVLPFNNARSGARMVDMAEQAREADKQNAAYVVVLLGANDVCAGTPVREFQGELALGAQVLANAGARVLLTSVPDVTHLVALYGDDETARAVWSAYKVCPRVLSQGADLDAARALIEAYNNALEAEATARGWHWDGGAVHAVAYEAGDVSTVDYFHPSLSGQARLAEATWAVSPYANGTRGGG